MFGPTVRQCSLQFAVFVRIGERYLHLLHQFAGVVWRFGAKNTIVAYCMDVERTSAQQTHSANVGFCTYELDEATRYLCRETNQGTHTVQEGNGVGHQTIKDVFGEARRGFEPTVDHLDATFCKRRE